MKHIAYIIIILMLVSIPLDAQKKKFSKKISKPSPKERIESAMQLSLKDPTAAIELINGAMLEARKSNDHETSAQGYFVLGNIYQSIGQDELAMQRYHSALGMLSSKDFEATEDYPESKSKIYLKMADLSIENKNTKSAMNLYRGCLEWATDEDMKLKCEEGIADVYLELQALDNFLAQYDKIEKLFDLDSLSLARKEARMAKYFLFNKDDSNVQISLNNSIKIYNESKNNSDFNPTEYIETEKVVAGAQGAVMGSPDVSNIGKIESQTQTIKQIPEAEKLSQVKENLLLAELYEKENDNANAKKYIDVSKSMISKETDVAITAEVFKKSAGLNVTTGNLAEAWADREKYIEAKEEAIEELKADLNEQIEIVKKQGSLDINQKELDIQEGETKLMETQISTQKILIGLLTLFLFGSLTYFYFLRKNINAKKAANQKLRLRSLGTQMNPHFTFNALNSVNNFIAKNDEKSANKFLSDFSKLMRKVVDNSQKDFITFEEEMELNQLYLKLEQFRFREKFDYTFENQISTAYSQLEVPPMIIQPLIENAVWHGLRYKEGKGQLNFKTYESDRKIIIEISDNGVGRERSKQLKTKNQKQHKSTGIDNIKNRLQLLNDMYNKNYELTVSNLDDAAEDKGTQARLTIPV